MTGLRLRGMSNFDFISNKINARNIWKVTVFIRTNPLTASGGYFFSRWMQLSKRGILLGLPTAGAGGGTNDFILKNTQTQITFPLRDRIILGDDKPIEENSVIHEYLFDEYLMNFFKEYKQ